MSRETAETVALRALTWLLADEELMPVFMGATGAAADDVRDRPQDPDFLGSVLDFLLMDDTWIVAFCAAHDLPNETPMLARAMLPGGENVHWT